MKIILSKILEDWLERRVWIWFIFLLLHVVNAKSEFDGHSDLSKTWEALGQLGKTGIGNTQAGAVR